ncbi:MAG: protein kinase, partial [Planctomycetota bacterium]
MSKPYLCQCGNLVNVAEIAPGTHFRCPSCSSERLLELSDPGLLEVYGDSDGVYNMLLEKRLSGEQKIAHAVPVMPRASVTQTAPVPRPGGEGAAGEEASRSGNRGDGTAPPDLGSKAAEPLRSRLPLGSMLGPYRLDALLGQGGMGTVYEAFDTSLQRTVALKVLGGEHALDREVIDRFRREARAAAALTHPNITHIYSIGEDKGHHYFSMELVRGRTLAEILKEQRVLEEEAAVDYLLQVAHGLRAAKRKAIIHRDIKPSNLILSEDGLVKITDFGLAKVVTSSVDITATGVIIGTPLYMSPEQGKGEHLDHRSDIYSLGCTLFHLLAGLPPHQGETAMTIIVSHITEEVPLLKTRCPSLGERLCSVIQRMMQKNAKDRYQDYDQLIEALSAISSASTTTRVEGVELRRTVLVSERSEGIPGDSMSLKQLSVADVNLELGRLDKALSLYHKVLEDNPELETDLSFRLLKVHRRLDNKVEVERLYRRILEASDCAKERFFCRWKLLSAHFSRCLEEIELSRHALEKILGDEVPPSVERKRLKRTIRTVGRIA